MGEETVKNESAAERIEVDMKAGGSISLWNEAKDRAEVLEGGGPDGRETTLKRGGTSSGRE